jgi:hypothetical protein
VGEQPKPLPLSPKSSSFARLLRRGLFGGLGELQADLAITLLDAIARDGLYDAVIDRDVETKKRKTFRMSRRSKTASD